ncbi:hypothetical protein BDBG_16513, partial [Blastomyces gilchristii SLH14081]
SSCIDRSVSADNSELNIESLIENLKNVIMKKLSVLYVTESFISFSVSSVTSFSATLFSVPFSTAFSQSSTLVPVSDSPALTTSVSVTLTLTTSAFSDSTISAFIISSLCFKKMLYRLNELHFSRITLSLNSMKNICVFRNENINVVLFYTYECET